MQSSGVGFVNLKLEWNLLAQTINTNVLGVTKLYSMAYKLFKEQQFGHLVGISSIASIRGNRAAPDYFSSKAFQKAFLDPLDSLIKCVGWEIKEQASLEWLFE